MAFGSSYYSYWRRAMCSYEMAVDGYKSITPMRGTTDERRVWSRRDTSKTVRMVGEEVLFRLYNTDVVRWTPTHRYIRLGGYDASPTTVSFASGHSGLTITRHANSAWVKTIANGVLGWWRLHAYEENVFTSEGEFVNSLPATTHAIDRKGMKSARAMYTEFIQYLRMASLLRDEGYSLDEIRKVVGDRINWSGEVPSDTELHSKLMKLMRNKEEGETDDDAVGRFYEASAHLAASVYGYYLMNYASQKASVRPPLNTLLGRVDALVRNYHAECLREVDAPAGRMFKDRYGNAYIRAQRFKAALTTA